MSLEAEIRDALKEKFAPTRLTVTNESHKHAGHSGDDGSGESHWHVEIKSAEFSTLSRIARHRAVHAALGAKIIERIHALSLDISGDD